MKKMWKPFLLISAVAFFIVGCGNNEKESDKENIQPIKVVLNVQEKAKVNEGIPLSATVTQGKEMVADAAKVEYEVWEDGAKEESKMMDAKNEKNGKYISEVSFDHDGVFNIQVHVTARDMHMMPKKTIIVGNPDMSNVKSHSEDSNHNH
ncbi:hypothetical protein J6TS2_04710 [Heyndrickxia sporothermodurans]|nr:hypothetical protein J6TS2_04710 [Heyndrickxia sporothermodurans]